MWHLLNSIYYRPPTKWREDNAFSRVVSQSVHWGRGGWFLMWTLPTMHCTSLYRAPSVHGPAPWPHFYTGPQSLSPLVQGPRPPPSDIWWPRQETCSNLFTSGHPTPTPPVLTFDGYWSSCTVSASGRYASSWNALLFWKYVFLTTYKTIICAFIRLKIAFKWLVRAFSGYLSSDQVLLLWDRILAYNSLLILPGKSLWLLKKMSQAKVEMGHIINIII